MTDAAEVAARRAGRAATTGGTAYGIAAARLQYFYDGAPRGQEGDRVMVTAVTAVPMADRTGGGFDIAWVADCRAYVVQDGTLRQITEEPHRDAAAVTTSGPGNSHPLVTTY